MVKFKHLILLSKIIHKLDGVSYYSELEKKLQDIQDRNNKKIFDSKLDKEREKKYIEALNKEKQNYMLLDIAVFIASKFHIVQSEMIEFFCGIDKNLDAEKVIDLDVKELIEILKKEFSDGIPDILKEKVLEGLKKKQ